MKIENSLNKYKTLISNVDVGECFIYNEQLHMKVSIGSIKYPSIEHYPNIVLNLETNALNALKDSVEVVRINAKIVIE